MAAVKTVVGSPGLDDSIGPALRESGFQYRPVKGVEEALEAKADCVLVDARSPDWAKNISKLKGKVKGPILSWVRPGVPRDDLMNLQNAGATGYIREGTPAEEIVIRVRAMLDDKEDGTYRESRAARRVWFQQQVNFKIFDRDYQAWSTTLSETGIFLRTNLSFPLYSVIRMNFELMGETKPFECDGVIVRQEVEGPIRGLGIMFQNLKGESIIQLESFLALHR